MLFAKWLTTKERASGELRADQEYQLPTEAQWEYACRAGTTGRYFFGNDPEAMVSYGNIADAAAKTKINFTMAISGNDNHIYTAPMGSFKANPFSLFDMHGNASEWCAAIGLRKKRTQSLMARSLLTQRVRITYFTRFCVLRGGSWFSGPTGSRDAFRDRNTPTDRYDYSGFRLLRIRSYP